MKRLLIAAELPLVADDDSAFTSDHLANQSIARIY